jgi:hypothetical protein
MLRKTYPCKSFRQKGSFPYGDGQQKRSSWPGESDRQGEGAASLTLKAAQWSGAGGVALHPNKPFFRPFSSAHSQLAGRGAGPTVG